MSQPNRENVSQLSTSAVLQSLSDDLTMCMFGFKYVALRSSQSPCAFAKSVCDPKTALERGAQPECSNSPKSSQYDPKSQVSLILCLPPLVLRTEPSLALSVCTAHIIWILSKIVPPFKRPSPMFSVAVWLGISLRLSLGRAIYKGHESLLCVCMEQSMTAVLARAGIHLWEQKYCESWHAQSHIHQQEGCWMLAAAPCFCRVMRVKWPMSQ